VREVEDQAQAATRHDVEALSRQVRALRADLARDRSGAPPAGP
jgi:hypothetical protein